MMNTLNLTVNNLIQRTSWDAIWFELSLHYPKILDNEGSDETFKSVFGKLKTIVPEPSELALNIKIFFDEGKRIADVAAYNEEEPMEYSMICSSWSSWLGLAIAT